MVVARRHAFQPTTSPTAVGSVRTSGASSGAYSANAAGGSTSRSGKTRPIACGQYVPQWIGHGGARPDEPERLGGLQRVEMQAATEGRSPAPDRDERDVDRSPEVAHPVEQVRVAGEVDRSGCRGSTNPSGGAVGPNGGR